MGELPLCPAELIVFLEAPDPDVREWAFSQLVALGPGALPTLEEVLETASDALLLTLAELLALSGSPTAIRPLLFAYARVEVPHRPALYQRLQSLLEHYIPLPDGAWKAIQASTLRTAPLVARQIKTTLSLPLEPTDGIAPHVFRSAPTNAEIASLTALLRWQRTGDVARQAATALHQIALTAPAPQLREALPFLSRAWHIRFAHPELLQAMRAIEAATVLWKDLPLPAESDSYLGSHGLPLPVE